MMVTGWRETEDYRCASRIRGDDPKPANILVAVGLCFRHPRG